MVAAQKTLMHIRNVHEAGGAIAIIALDEPLKSAQEDCHLSVADAARRTATYAHTVESSDEARLQGVTPTWELQSPIHLCR